MKKLLKKFLVSTLTLSVLVAAPLATYASVSAVVSEVAVEEEAQQITPFTQVRVRPTGAWGFASSAGTTAFWITGGPTVNILRSENGLTQVSGGGPAHLLWFRPSDLGFWH